MELLDLFELQFCSYLVKDAANVNCEDLEWQSICICSSESDLKTFIHSLEVVDSFKSKISSCSFMDDFALVYRYRLVPFSKKFLVL